MILITNDRLEVAVLHPVEDREKLGSRYCTGGYIHQVRDRGGRDLLAGPSYPGIPSTFDGQGAPETFPFSPGADDAPIGSEVWVMGVGLVAKDSDAVPFQARHNPRVTRFSDWEIRQGTDRVEMRTSERYGGWAAELRREVVLSGDTVVSRTTVRNEGKKPLPFRWFAHPFFHIPHDLRICRFPMPVTVEENPGFFVRDGDTIMMKPEHDWKSGCFQPIASAAAGGKPAIPTDRPGGVPTRSAGMHAEARGEAEAEGKPDRPDLFTADQYHDGRGGIAVACDFTPSFLPIWANANTVSFEPYHEGVLPPGKTTLWRISYTFR